MKLLPTYQDRHALYWTAAMLAAMSGAALIVPGMGWPWSVGCLAAAAVTAAAGALVLRHVDRQAYNCASCGKHQPLPSTIVTLNGRFPDGDRLHAGVCVVWCKGCAPVDVLHDSLMHHVHGADATKTMLVLRALARRGVGRVTWMSQETVDKLRKITGSAVHDLTTERTFH